jgi:pilus assembly protein CpaD
MKSRHNRRIFRRHRRRRTTLLAALAVIVAGCAQTVADWTPATTSNELQVKWVTHDHTISFNSRANLLTNREARSLDRFLSQIDLRPSDRLFVDVGPQSGEVVSDTRIDVINEQLRHYVPGAQALAITGEKGTAGNIRLIVGRYVVLPPNCPDLSRPSASNPGNFNDSNFGCSTQRNLGLMLADPGDLLRGRSLGPADGEAMSRGIRDYRAGKAKKPVLLEMN